MRSDNARTRLDRTRSATPTLYLPLRRLALCLDCDACFDVAMPACPGCSGDTWMPLARFLDQRPLRPLPEIEFPRSRPANGKGVAKQIVVVARGREALYDDLKRAFADNPTVEVVLDRRRGERRAGGRLRIPDRRRGDRRLTVDVDHQLRALGWAVVRLDVFRSPDRLRAALVADGQPASVTR